MQIKRRFIVAIGQIPPPTDGLAYITSEYVKLLSEDHDVKVLNISPRVGKRGVAYHFSRTVSVLLASMHLVFNARRGNRICYMPCQSDFGVIYTVYLLTVARLLQYPTYLHHHNFGYINEARRMMRMVLHGGGPKVVHIFLCEPMRDRFGRTYWPPERSIIVSNSAFVSPQPKPSAFNARSSLRIGLLSNLNREKGLHIFLDLLRAARDEGLNICGTLAGPVREPADRLALEMAQEELGDRLIYAGSVYGDEKLRFYTAIDVFVFPTIYANEAQPTVIYEALAAGNLILTYERGCIVSQVNDNGLVLSQDLPFVPHAMAWLKNLLERGSFDVRTMIANQTSELHQVEREKARTLFTVNTLDGSH
ncbi:MULTISPECIES: glycosyltransferase family 4 protein [unclassified Bradyrhizobium]|uniref:glycosyltransferase family 4 protein n=1 Tax=unclassified Bradyrhizobium TaxID=2631580 RepID=UPI001FFB67F1|nr:MULTISPECIES: glycosyltransferase family 4 protein [unclassified Bradyrhizobium]MCK1707674.1 glycosyltransferase family 4 protein [Bradyrhizobium sp. 143]MCK1731746.1 glycosyltransferase family 4 protein [Bradyrhizobium sp. 142]